MTKKWKLSFDGAVCVSGSLVLTEDSYDVTTPTKERDGTAGTVHTTSSTVVQRTTRSTGIQVVEVGRKYYLPSTSR